MPGKACSSAAASHVRAAGRSSMINPTFMFRADGGAQPGHQSCIIQAPMSHSAQFEAAVLQAPGAAAGCPLIRWTEFTVMAE